MANKQDQRGAIKSEFDLKRKLDLDALKRKYKIVSDMILLRCILIKNLLRNYALHYLRIIEIKSMNPFEKVFHG